MRKCREREETQFSDMFRLTEPSSGQIRNIVLVHSVSAHIMCFVFGLMMAQ
jgi:hypothetical protein